SGNYSRREAGSLQGGVVAANAGTSAITVTVEATSTSGVLAGSTTATIPARGQRVLMLSDIPGVSVPFTGILWVSAPTGSAVSVDGFRARFNERSTPDSLVTGFSGFDEAQVLTGDLLFPQVVDSAGFSTQFALIGVRGTQSSGSVQFSSQAGQAL